MFANYIDKTVEGEHYLSEKIFNNCKYYLWVTVEGNKAFVSLSSGNKRKNKFVFEEKPIKSKGGLNALIWAKNEMLTFKKWFEENYKWKSSIKYLYAFPADSRRRKIYARLKFYGFRDERHPIYGLGLCKRY